VFARYLEQREARRPDPIGRALRRRLLAASRGLVLEVGSGDGRSFEHYPTRVTGVLALEPDPTAGGEGGGTGGPKVNGKFGLPTGRLHIFVVVCPGLRCQRS
jgi:hypothetical protein